MESVRNLARMRTILLVLFMSLVVALTSSPAAAGGSRVADPGGNQGNARVYPPGSMPFGMSYGAWTQRWWQWAYGLPVAGHPLFDETGADCATGQSGPVWFLGGIFNVSGTANRTLCSIPAGKALFFPLINVEWDNLCPPTEPPLSVEQLKSTAAAFMDGVTELSCELDGRSLGNLWSYRFTADPFGVEMPSGNIWEAFGCPTPAGHYEPLVPDGFFLMLTPLSPGSHTLHFTGRVSPPAGDFALDITYELTVVPGHASATGTTLEPSVEGLGSLGDTSNGPGATTTWGRVKGTYR